MGGLGKRLGALTQGRPKPLVDVCGKPFFTYQLELMKAQGFRRFLLLVGYRAEQIEEYFGDGRRFGVSIEYRYDGETLLGTGGAIKRAADALDEDFLLLYGDSFMDIDFAEVLYRYWRGKKEGCRALMCVFENGDRLETSNVLFRGGKLLLYDKRNPTPDMDYVDYGVSMFERSLFLDAPEGPFDIALLQNALSVSNQLASCEVTRRFYEIGSPESLSAFTAYAGQRFGEANPAVFLDRDGVINALHVSEDTELLDSPLKAEQLALLPGAAEGIRLFKRAGYWVFIVTNQPAAAKGKTTLEKLYDVNTLCLKRLKDLGAEVDGAFLCPHFPSAGPLTREGFLIEDCDCRKPAPGLIKMAMERFSIDSQRSLLAGDSYRDILAGRAAGLKTAFIGTYKCDVCQLLRQDRPDCVYPSLLALAQAWTGAQATTKERK